jgi:hypothetical protein
MTIPLMSSRTYIVLFATILGDFAGHGWSAYDLSLSALISEPERQERVQRAIPERRPLVDKMYFQKPVDLRDLKKWNPDIH